MRTCTKMMVVVLVSVTMSSADVFNMGGTRNPDGSWNGLASLETVPVGDPRNAGDSRYGGYGSVSYAYNIGKYEVTAGQYCEFLNAVAKTDTYGLYNGNMWWNGWGCKIEQIGGPGSYQYSVAADWANRPVNYVSWGDAARFANWLHNGQPTGAQGASTTEHGAYTLDGATTDAQLIAVSRNSNWKWAITSEDEWYKAAYYKGGGTNAGYFNYPTSSDTAPSSVLGISTDGGNRATFVGRDYTIGNPYYRTEVGDHENSGSPYGTFDQGGNVWEWNEAVIWYFGSYRGLRGGSYWTSDSELQASYRYFYSPMYEGVHFGFRVSEVPEPASMILILIGGIGLFKRSRK